MSTVIEPTVGRVVWFWPDGEEAFRQPLAATVAHVHGPRMINIGYLSANGIPQGGQTSVVLVQEGDTKPERNYCTWMPYQTGQAKKQQDEAKA